MQWQIEQPDFYSTAWYRPGNRAATAIASEDHSRLNRHL